MTGRRTGFRLTLTNTKRFQLSRAACNKYTSPALYRKRLPHNIEVISDNRAKDYAWYQPLPFKNELVIVDAGPAEVVLEGHVA
jgi:hypothetical protein